MTEAQRAISVLSLAQDRGVSLDAGPFCFTLAPLCLDPLPDIFAFRHPASCRLQLFDRQSTGEASGTRHTIGRMSQLTVVDVTKEYPTRAEPLVVLRGCSLEL